MKKKLLIGASLFAVLSGGAYLGAGYALKPIATQFIRQNGFPEAHISSLSIFHSGVMIDKISLDGDDFSTIENMVISLDWGDFIQTRKIRSVEIKDISVIAELDEDNHLKIAGWDATLPSSKSSSSLLPIQSVLLHGITLDIDTPQGDIRIEGKLSLETPTPNQQKIEYALWGQQHQLSFDAKGSGKLSSKGDINFSTTLNEGRLNLPHIELSRASGEIQYTKGSGSPSPHITGKLLAGKINTLGALLQNVTVNLDTSKTDSLSFKTSPAGYKDIQIEGKWITHPESYLELSINALKSIQVIELLSPDNVKKYKSLAAELNPLTLTIKASTNTLQNDAKKADFQLALGKNSSEMSLNTKGTATYDAKTSQTSIKLDKSVLQVAGGKIEASPFGFNTGYDGKTPISLSLSVKSLDMSKMAKLAEIQGLSVKGRLSGTLPVTYSDKGLVFGEGTLSSDGDGVFAYQPDSFPPAFQGDDERMQMVRDALSDFNFSKLSFDMSGGFDSQMKTTLTAEGINPSLGGQPIKLNLNLDGDIGAVIKQALQAGDIPDKIRSR